MKNLALVLACLLVAGFASAANAQRKAADYKLTRIKIVPFEQQTGNFESEIRDADDRAFFNEISKTYLVTVEIAGEAGSYEDGRKIEITVTEGKKLKTKKLDQIGLIGEGGKFYVPLWIDAPLCDDTTIAARIVGQRTPVSLKRKITVFQCGE